MSERSLTRQELFELVWSTPMATLAKDFRLSGVGLAKLCRRHGIPHPGRGFWARKAAGQSQRRPKLPAAPTGVPETIYFRRPDRLETPIPSPEAEPEVREWTEREALPENAIRVPAQVHRYHPLVQRTRQDLVAFADTRGARFSRGPGLDVSVAPQSVGRTCRLLHTLLVELEKRGFHVTTRPERPAQTTVHLLGEEVYLAVREPYRRGDEAQQPKGRGPTGGERALGATAPTLAASGLFRLKLSTYGVDANFRDKDQEPLESQLNAVIVSMVRLAVEVHRPRRLHWEEVARQRREEETRRREFDAKRSMFEKALAAWEEHQKRVRFLAELETRLAANPEEDQSAREYFAWAREYVDWANPLPRLFSALEDGEEPEFPKWEPPAPFGRW